MQTIKKLYGGLNITWPRLIIAAAAIGLIVGGIMLIPVSDQSSLKDIGTNFEWWIFFATVIVANSKSPVDSAAKAFAFFLISQPLIYLVQVPFSDMGWGLFGYYKYWFLWTLATIPMGAVGHFIRRGDAVGSLILSAMTVFLVYHLTMYVSKAMDDFPHHLASAVLCVIFIVLPILGTARTKYAKLIAWGAAAAAIAVFIFIYVLKGGGTRYSPRLNCRENGIEVSKDSRIVASVNVYEHQIYEADGEYYLYTEITGKEAEVTVETDGRERTYEIRFDDDTQTFTVTQVP